MPDNWCSSCHSSSLSRASRRVEKGAERTIQTSPNRTRDSTQLAPAPTVLAIQTFKTEVFPRPKSGISGWVGLVAGDLAPWDIAVVARFAWKAEHTLTNDVSHHI